MAARPDRIRNRVAQRTLAALLCVPVKVAEAVRTAHASARRQVFRRLALPQGSPGSSCRSGAPGNPACRAGDDLAIDDRALTRKGQERALNLRKPVCGIPAVLEKITASLRALCGWTR